MRAILGVFLCALLAACMVAPPAPKPVSKPVRLMIGTPTDQVMTPALKALQQSQHDTQLLAHFTVHPDGSVTNPRAQFTELSPEDTTAVLAAIQQWHFKPAREQGRPVVRDFIYPLFFGPDARNERTVFLCRNQASIYEPARHCDIVTSGDWRIYRLDPVYPPELLNRRLAGSVTLGFDIGTDGRAVAPKVVVADPPGLFDAAAIAAVKEWYFERLGGKSPAPEASHQHVTVSVQFTPPPAQASAAH
jgi:TonB family protein